VLERRCCRAASGARAAGGPARRIGLPPVTWRPLIAGKGYLAEIAPEPAALPPDPSSLSVVEPLLPGDEGSPRYPPPLRRSKTSDNVSPRQRKPFGGYGVDTPKRAYYGGSARVLLQPSMTQRYKMDGRLAGDTPKQRGDIVFDYSNVSEGN
jgi:hypothetical protein